MDPGSNPKFGIRDSKCRIFVLPTVVILTVDRHSESRITTYDFIAGYDRKVKPGRFILIVIYMGYMVNAGLMLVLLPWSRAWGMLLTRFPISVASHLDAPWFRGLLSAFGVLHLIIVAWELINPTLLTPPAPSGTQPQKNAGP
jgi:hypothetical protein